MLVDLPRPTIFAHRGASAYAPENTMAAFKLAIEQGAHALEFDVKLSADHIVVVIHDRTVDRTTNGSGLVAKHTLNELKVLDAGSSLHPSFRGEKIPTLEEVLTGLSPNTILNIELKNYHAPMNALPEKVVDLVQQYARIDQVIFSSFNPFALRRIHHHIPQATIGSIALPGLLGLWARSWLGRWVPYNALHIHYQDATWRFTKQAHDRGIRVHAYTVNQETDMRRLAGMGVDGIFTDDPLLARSTLEVQG